MLIAPARRSTAPLTHGLRYLYGRLAHSCRPRVRTSVSSWADSHRVLSKKASAEPGPWRTDRAPYTREPMDCLSVTSPVQTVVLMWAAQVAKTEVGLNWIGYTMDHAPAPMLVVVPTLEVRKRWVRQRLDPMLEETPALREIFGGKRSRAAAQSEDIKDYPGGMTVIGGANSAASLASMPIKNVLCDEVDRFQWEVGQEGDPLGLIEERQKTFSRRKTLLVSSPTVKGMSRIESAYEASDQREYHVPCPHCSEYQVLKWRHPDGTYGLVYSQATGLVRYACRHCGVLIEEHFKAQMLARGRWIARHPERKVRGYWISGLYSPLGLGFTWAEIWAKWQDAHGDTAKLKRFVNTTLAETWEEQGDSIADLELIARLEEFPDRLPLALRTSWTDVQKDRLETTVVGWGPGEEAWVLEHEIHEGDTADTAVWDELDVYLRERRIDQAGVDSGFNASMVYAFCDKRRWVVPTKGQPGMARPLIEDEKRRKQRLRTRRRKGAYVELLGVDQGKSLLFSRLKVAGDQVSGRGPKVVHFPKTADFDDEYFAQLAAEKLVTRKRGSRPYQEWVQTRARNEALDCMVGNFAMLAMLQRAGKSLEGAELVPLVATAEDTTTSARPAPPVPAPLPPQHEHGDWSFERRT